MGKLKRHFSYFEDGSLNIPAWLQVMQEMYGLQNTEPLKKAAEFSEQQSKGLTTFFGKPHLELGLEVAEILFTLKLDIDTVAASIICTTIQLTPAMEEKIRKAMGEPVLKLARGIKKLDSLASLPLLRTQPLQIDKIRKMLLTMATDIRVVVIKLVERLAFMHGIKAIPLDERKPYAQEVLDIFAPLANRLGIGQLKWELEDIAFHYLNPTAYKTIATFLAERRVDREKRIQELIKFLHHKLDVSHIKGQITGRAKHIYSIYLKAQRKDVNFSDIYDASAIRILVSKIEECYTVLSLVHHLWTPIMNEFDDYIAHPKPNGYRSIHTAVIDEFGKHFEIQIRTQAMHDEAERGVAAHWMYKEQKLSGQSDLEKIEFLRQLLDWQKEISGPEANLPQAVTAALQDVIYVITPAGDILDLPQGATPLDFAYHIHSELGHRCRGAKVNGQIVPLSYTLRTGDKTEINTILEGNPSRDWLNSELGYIKTARAKSKILHWFKHEVLHRDIDTGKQLLEKELMRQGITKTESLITLARHFGFKSEDSLLIALARGNIRIGQILQNIQPRTEEPVATPHTSINKIPHQNYGSAIVGAADLLTRLAKCCKPIPGDPIVGYITQGRGISIHKKNCPNLSHLTHQKIMDVSWDNNQTDTFSTDLKIIAQGQDKILHDLTSLFASEKIVLLRLESNFNKLQHQIYITVTIQIQDNMQLQRLLHRIRQLPAILDIQRIN